MGSLARYYIVPIVEKFVERAKAVRESTPAVRESTPGYRPYSTAETAVPKAHPHSLTYPLAPTLSVNEFVFEPAESVSAIDLLDTFFGHFPSFSSTVVIIIVVHDCRITVHVTHGFATR